MKQIKFPFIAIALIVVAVSCKKTNSGTVPPITDGLLVLNQGNFGHNNTTLTYYDLATSKQYTDYFADINHFGLGDAGSDFIVYGGKIYIVMNNSGNVTVVNSSTGKLVDTIGFTNAGVNRQPENIVSYGGKVFVSSTDGTVAVIDTTTLTVSQFITVGANPAQMVVSGTNLYVSNTGGFSAEFDSTVSVINLTTLTETQKIVVGVNPGSLAADNSGNIYVACTGDYNTVAPSLVKVDISTNTVIKSADTTVGTVRFYNGNLYVTGGYLGAPVVRILSTTDFSLIANFITDNTAIENPYGVDIDSTTGDVYIADAKDYSSAGEVFSFDNTGKLRFSFSVKPGISPCKVIPISH
ncbi:MAG TPA: DUF5074 domain-containing protein [Ferruginibacter sp.]|jgi:YVTN family beta-propeller protein|nr:DUF5074 domain-containing protein [Ferruginibacter sp.]